MLAVAGELFGVQGPEPLPLPKNALPGAPLAVEVVAKAEVLGCECAEFGPGGAGVGGFGLLAPAFEVAWMSPEKISAR